MPYCTACGSSVDSLDRYCSECGAGRRRPAGPATTDHRFEAPRAGARSTDEQLLWRGIDSLETRAKWTVAAIIGFGVTAAAMVLVTLWEIDLLERLNAGEFVSPEEAESVDLWVGLVSLAYIGVYVAAAVAFCFWIHRASANLHEAGNDLEVTPGWAVGWYFVPIANLVQPYRVMRELWRHSESTQVTSPLSGPALVKWWWALYLITGWLGWIVARMLWSDPETLDEWIEANWLGVATDALAIVLCIVAMALVRGLTRLQRERLAIRGPRPSTASGSLARA